MGMDALHPVSGMRTVTAATVAAGTPPNPLGSSPRLPPGPPPLSPFPLPHPPPDAVAVAGEVCPFWSATVAARGRGGQPWGRRRRRHGTPSARRVEWRRRQEEWRGSGEDSGGGCGSGGRWWRGRVCAGRRGRAAGRPFGRGARRLASSCPFRAPSGGPGASRQAAAPQPRSHGGAPRFHLGSSLLPVPAPPPTPTQRSPARGGSGCRTTWRRGWGWAPTRPDGQPAGSERSTVLTWGARRGAEEERGVCERTRPHPPKHSHFPPPAP